MRIRIPAVAIAIIGTVFFACGGDEDPVEQPPGGSGESIDPGGSPETADAAEDDLPPLLVEPFSEGKFPHEGHHPVFSGRDLRGWTTKVGRPMSPAIWEASDRALVGRLSDTGEGGLIRTSRAYTSYVAQVDFLVEGDVFAGVLPRMHPNSAQVELLMGGDGGGIMKIDGDASIPFQSGGAYRPGEWNHLELRARGNRMLLEVWLNGAFQARLQIPPNSDREDEPWSNRGSLATSIRPRNEESPDFEARASFRNIVVRYLPQYDPEFFDMDDEGFLSVTEAGFDAGWSSIFDHQSLEGWEGLGGASGASVDGGILRLPTSGEPGLLQSSGSFEDFHLLVEYRLGAKVDSGIFVRHDPEADAGKTDSLEVNLVDDLGIEASTGRKVEPLSRNIALAGIRAPVTQGMDSPVGKWNTVLIGCHKDEVVATLNQQLLFQVKLESLKDLQPPYGVRSPEGRIAFEFNPAPGLEGETYLDLRNVFVRRLNP